LKLSCKVIATRVQGDSASVHYRIARAHEGSPVIKIGIGLPNQVRDVDPRTIVPWAAAAEASGFSTLATMGRIAYPGVMDTVALAAAATTTDSIGLLSGILLGPVWPATLLAKEIAGIDGISGGRLTLGLGIGRRADDYVSAGHGAPGRGKRLDRDLETFRSVWRGESVGGGVNSAVRSETREVPMMFGGAAPAALTRMAHWGVGYIGPVVPPSMVAPVFDAARQAWTRAGRSGTPKLTASTYFAAADAERGRRGVYDYYLDLGHERATFMAQGMVHGQDGIREAVKAYTELGVDELIFNPALGDLDEVTRLAQTVL
jgi:alkanesulfonate monooxygenase SsuD/methylene tetrahydromethanopterin reductase-like flavin-dependent oxidoreductase (luciferase family)